MWDLAFKEVLWRAPSILWRALSPRPVEKQILPQGSGAWLGGLGWAPIGRCRGPMQTRVHGPHLEQ